MIISVCHREGIHGTPEAQQRLVKERGGSEVITEMKEEAKDKFMKFM